MASSYSKVPLEEEEEEEEDTARDRNNSDDIELTGFRIASTALDDYSDDDDALETKLDQWARASSSRPSLDLLEEQLLYNVWNRWEEPCLLSILVTILLLMPTLLLWIVEVYMFSGRLWPVSVFTIHLHLRVAASQWYVRSISTINFKYRRMLRLTCSSVTLLEIVLCGYLYPYIINNVEIQYFRDVDRTITMEWQATVNRFRFIKRLGLVVVIFRVLIGICAVSVRSIRHFSSFREWRPTFWTPYGEETMSDKNRVRLYSFFQHASFLLIGLNVVCFLSVLSHFGPWPMTVFPESCNPLDTTECSLPFPSFHHMKRDPTSETGWRVQLKGLPPLRGGIPFHPKFLNELDGFSTMAPILFYMEGLKEAYEDNIDNRSELQGLERISYSTTPDSITLLLDVDSQVLVPHSAEVDYLDAIKPVIMVIPSSPLKHATHYAVAVFNAPDKEGHKLPPTPGMQQLLKETNSEQRQRYMKKLIPALEKAAPWIKFADEPESLQLLFDFVTISEASQLGNVRTARDATLKIVNARDWDWHQHIETVKVQTQNCDSKWTRIAKTIHINFDTPSFLQNPSSRYSSLDSAALASGIPVGIVKTKASIRIPCSVEKGTKKLKAVMEYGRMYSDHLSSMVDEHGYILTGLEWRGMSMYDLPVLVRVLLGNPSQFESVRDNLIQGFANKLAFQHFVRHGDFLDWLEKRTNNIIHTWQENPPVSVFYGISQGGILGAGYLSLAGKTNLIDRGILGDGGTPWALVLTRSLDFEAYDALLKLNFYNNRHVRIVLSLLQMAWDSVEASGLLAPPVRPDEIPPRTLLYAGLGDPIVPTGATEALARAMNASTLPGNPRSVFGLPQENAAANETWIGPRVTLTELLFEKDYSSLPLEDKIPPDNHVHGCTRKDAAIITQVSEFTNTGHVVDVCEYDKCRRPTCGT